MTRRPGVPLRVFFITNGYSGLRQPIPPIMHCHERFWGSLFVPVIKHISGTLRVIPQHIKVSRYADITGMKYRRKVFENDVFETIYWNSTTHTK